MSFPGEVLRVAAPALAVPVVVARVSEHWVVRRLARRHAKHPDLAVPLPSHNGLVRWTLRRLVRARAVRDTSHGLYYLVSDEYAAYVRRRRLVEIALAVALAGIVAAVWFSDLFGQVAPSVWQ